MADGKLYREKLERAAAGKVEYRIAPYMCYHEVKGRASIEGSPAKRLEEFMNQLIKLMGRELPLDRRYYRGSSEMHATPWVTPPMQSIDYARDRSFVLLFIPEHAKLLGDLDSAIRDALVETAKHERARGASAILGLASGEFTVTDFNEAASGDNLQRIDWRRDKS